MRIKCDFCKKDKRKVWKCPDCGTTLCDNCCKKEYNGMSLIKAPFTILTLGLKDTKKRICLKCDSKNIRRI